jgi:hypothetical protein
VGVGCVVGAGVRGRCGHVGWIGGEGTGFWCEGRKMEDRGRIDGVWGGNLFELGVSECEGELERGCDNDSR